MGIVGKVLLVLATLTAFVGAEDIPQANVTLVPYGFEGTDLVGSMAVPEGDGPFPAIVIVPGAPWEAPPGAEDYEYEKIRATTIAKDWGFVGFQADIYGPGATELPSKDTLAARIDAAIDVVSKMDNVDASMITIFGFSSPSILTYALKGMGSDTVKAIVSFHSHLLMDWLPDQVMNVGPNVLFLSGGDEYSAEGIMNLETIMDQSNATWEVTRYSGASHSFTNYFDDEEYNEWADNQSWNSAYVFVGESFGMVDYSTISVPPEAESTVAVEYTDIDGTLLKGWLAMPDSTWQRPLPAVVIIPDWDGVNKYEKERATLLAEMGYVAFAADIYGADKQYVESFQDRAAEVTFYRSNPEVFMSRMQSGIDQVKLLTDDVLEGEIALIGYCFGGTGVSLYGIRGGQDAKAAVAFHGTFSEAHWDVVEPSIIPYMLILSGGNDGSHGNQTIMEDAYNSADANWEITRYSGVDHGYTAWAAGAYNLVADARSWNSMLELFEAGMPLPEQEGPDMPTMPPADADTSQDDTSDDSTAFGVGIVKSLFISFLFIVAM